MDNNTGRASEESKGEISKNPPNVFYIKRARKIYSTWKVYAVAL
jgi:hypothetical protein